MQSTGIDNLYLAASGMLCYLNRRKSVIPTRNFMEPRQHLTTYHNNNSLIIQFALFELIQAYKHVEIINSYLQDSRSTPLNKLGSAISSLTGRTQEYMRIFTWNLNDGILAKLKSYCSYYANNIAAQQPDISAVQKHADRAWINCLESADILRRMDKSTHIHPSDREELQEKLSRTLQRLQQLASVLSKQLLQFRDDENVLFFLLRFSRSLDSIYEEGFVLKLFSKMFSDGIPAAKAKLSVRYAERKFEHLLPQITQKLSTLATEDICTARN